MTRIEERFEEVNGPKALFDKFGNKGLFNQGISLEYNSGIIKYERITTGGKEILGYSCGRSICERIILIDKEIAEPVYCSEHQRK